ncbi:MAG: DUF4398 domain-containing protein [Dokdonella sp.]
MTASHKKIHALVAVASIALMQGCTPTRPPADELDAASRALGNAKAADAAAFAPIDYRAAEQHFDQARAAEGREDYDESAQFARESTADSELAIAKARLAKAHAAVDQLRQDNATLDRDLSEHATPEAQP